MRTATFASNSHAILVELDFISCLYLKSYSFLLDIGDIASPLAMATKSVLSMFRSFDTHNLHIKTGIINNESLSNPTALSALTDASPLSGALISNQTINGRQFGLRSRRFVFTKLWFILVVQLSVSGVILSVAKAIQ